MYLCDDTKPHADDRGEAAEQALRDVMNEMNVLRHGNKVMQVAYNKLVLAYRKLLAEKDRDQDMAKAEAGL